MTQATDLLSRLRVTAAHAEVDGRRVATLWYAGKVVTVKSTADKALGRLMPRGYDRGAPDDGSGRVDAWTAKHPSVPTPSDTLLERDLTIAEGVALLLSRAALYSFP
jgi:hypothetical protein